MPESDGARPLGHAGLTAAGNRGYAAPSAFICVRQVAPDSSNRAGRRPRSIRVAERYGVGQVGGDSVTLRTNSTLVDGVSPTPDRVISIGLKIVDLPAHTAMAPEGWPGHGSDVEVLIVSRALPCPAIPLKALLVSWRCTTPPGATWLPRYAGRGGSVYGPSALLN